MTINPEALEKAIRLVSGQKINKACDGGYSFVGREAAEAAVYALRDAGLLVVSGDALQPRFIGVDLGSPSGDSHVEAEVEHRPDGTFRILSMKKIEGEA